MGPVDGVTVVPASSSPSTAAHLAWDSLRFTYDTGDRWFSGATLTRDGWIFTEPSVYNPPGNLRPSSAPANPVPTLAVDLASETLPLPRLKVEKGIVAVPAYTDFKLHDITTGPGDPNEEPLDMNRQPGTPEFFTGNRKFLTRKLWGVATEPPYFHHGKFTTLREAILAHIEFLKTLQVLPPGTADLVVDAQYQKKTWPPPGVKL